MKIKALAIDTGGTVFDWHSTVVNALTHVCLRNGKSIDFHAAANDWRRRSLRYVAGRELLTESMDEVHRKTLELTLAEFGVNDLTNGDHAEILQSWYELKAWPDFSSAISLMRSTYQVISLTLLSAPLVIQNSRKNAIHWDAIFSCQMIGFYKPHLKTYTTTAVWLDLKPADIMMVACHNIDLNAAAKVGFRTAFVHRRNEWGPDGQADTGPNMEYDLIEESFEGLAQHLMS